MVSTIPLMFYYIKILFSENKYFEIICNGIKKVTIIIS